MCVVCDVCVCVCNASVGLVFGLLGVFLNGLWLYIVLGIEGCGRGVLRGVHCEVCL